MWTISSSFSKVVSIIFPPHCYGCGKDNISLCESCLSHCKKTLDTPSLYITSVYSFKDPLIKKAIHAIKYFHRKDLIAPLTTELAKEVNRLVSATPYTLSPIPCLLIPIPMPTLRKYMRGYNQSEEIAKELSLQCHLDYDSKILIRKISPKRQVTTKTRGERLKNQHNSFKVIKNVEGLHIILVDDVTTTGATFHEARETLLKAGAKSVKAVTLAH